MSHPYVHIRLYYTDSKNERRYLHNSMTGKVMELHTETDALKRRWAEAQRGSLLELEYVYERSTYKY